MKVCVTIYPPKDIQDIANSYRKRYDPQYSLIAPHIKLKEVFEIEEKERPMVTAELQKVAHQVEPFTLEMHKISTFQPTNNVIYLAIKEHPQLMRLHELLHEPEILQHKKTYAFVPHLTIGQNMSDDELRDVYGQLKMKESGYSFTVNRFHLIYQLDNESWTTSETFTLKGSTDEGED